MADFGVQTAANITSTAIIGLISHLRNAAESQKKLKFLTDELTNMEGLLGYIRNQFEEQQKTIPPPLQGSLEIIKNDLEEVKKLIDRAERQRPRCLGCGLFCHPNLPAQINDWKRNRFHDFRKQLKNVVSIVHGIQRLVDLAPPRAEVSLPDSGFAVSGVESVVSIAASSAPPSAELLLQPQPDSGFAVSGIESVVSIAASSALPSTELLLQPQPDSGSAVSGVESVVSIAASYAPPSAELLLQPLPDSGFVGSGVEAAYRQLITWLNEPNAQARGVIGVYGMAGVGKTALLRRIHNSYQEKKKKEVSGIFDSVIWHTVSEEYKPADLQASIDETLSLNLKQISNIDRRRMKLSACLESKRFLLILDDVWCPIDLDEVGVKFGDHEQSKVLISSRYRDVVETMAENVEYCKMIQPLSEDEGWELFRRRAFKSGFVPDNNLLAIATEVALECKGLPLAINVVATALARRKTTDEWRRALVMMKNADSSFPSTHKTIDAELYQRLRWSYNDLPDHNLKMCFLYCAAFPEDDHIEVERVVEMWTAEGLVPQKGKTYFMDVGRACIDALVDRCLLEYVDATEKKVIKVHDVLRDMAIYIGQREEKWLFLASQHLHHFSNDEDRKDLQRISLLHNDITHLPTEDLKCPTLVSLLLARNPLQAIPERFLANFMCLKVLDLSLTSIEALPASVGELRQLQFLNLKRCSMLQDLPDSICNLLHLQFLNLEDCLRLNSIPDRIGELKYLKHLHVSGIGRGFKVIPHQIYQLTSLNRLILSGSRTPLSVEDLSNLSNLIELNVEVEAEIKGVSMSTWSEMRILTLWFSRSEDGNRDDAALDILPRNMQSMRKLRSLSLHGYLGVSLPSCICKFQNLKYLSLNSCRELKELPALEVGSDAASGGFPMLEILKLEYLDSLERIVWTEGTMLKLQSLKITNCQVLQTFQTEELRNLRFLQISSCDELKEWFIRSGGFPMLSWLTLNALPKLVSVAVRSSMWSEETMPKLEGVEIRDCSLLRRLSMQNLPLVRQIEISDCCELLEVDIGNLPMLETLDLNNLEKLKSIERPSSVWNEKTVSKLQKLSILNCPLLSRLPVGMDTLTILREIVGKLDWWEGISWEDKDVKTKLFQLFIEKEVVTTHGESSQKEEIEEEEVLSD